MLEIVVIALLSFVVFEIIEGICKSIKKAKVNRQFEKYQSVNIECLNFIAANHEKIEELNAEYDNDRIIKESQAMVIEVRDGLYKIVEVNEKLNSKILDKLEKGDEINE
jgi:hypothetical protein